MRSKTTIENLQDLIQEIDAGIAQEIITPSIDLVEDLKMCEMELIELIILIEERFSVELNDSDVPKTQLLGEWIERIEQIQNKQNN